MRKKSLVLASCLATFVFIIIVIGNLVIVAQSTITGTWKSDTYSEKEGKNDGKIHLSFERTSEKGRNQHGSSFDYAELQGASLFHANLGGASLFRVQLQGVNLRSTRLTETKIGAAVWRAFPRAPPFSSRVRRRSRSRHLF